MFVGTFLSAFAHSPTNSTTVLVEGKDGKWMLQIRAALTAYETEVHTRFSVDSYKTQDEFKEKVIEFLKGNIAIVCNGNILVEIKNPIVKLGHETIVLFEFELPDDFKNLSVQNAGFSNIYMSKNTMLIVREGFGKKNFILEKANNFKIELVVDDKQFNEVHNNSSQSSFLPYMGVLIIFGVLCLVIKNIRLKTIL